MEPKTQNNSDLEAEEQGEIPKGNIATKSLIFSQGTQFEGMISTILDSEGYKTEKRKWFTGKSKTKQEIDIVAEKSGVKTLLIECKNYDEKRTVQSGELMKFKAKMDDIIQAHGQNFAGLFATGSHFSSEAELYADHHAISLWDHEKVYEKFYKASLGRGNIAPRLPLALPLTFGHEDAQRLSLRNPDLVATKKIELLWHPYFLIKYRIDVVRRLPNKNTYKDSAESYVVYDGVSNESVLYHDEGRILYDDLAEQSAIESYVVTFSHDYHTTTPPHKGPMSTIKKLAVRRIVERHTRNVKYQVKYRDSHITKSTQVVPSQKEVLLTDTSMIYVPEWNVTFEVGGIEYKRKMFGASGKLSIDAIGICSKNHNFIDKLKRRDDVAYCVCETCYGIFCQGHAVELNNRYFCKEHDPTPKEERKRGFFLFRR